MIITHQFVLLFFLAIFLALLVWILDAPRLEKLVGPGGFKRLRNLTAILLVVIIIWMCALNFPATLTALVAGTGIIALIDLIFFRRQRIATNRPQPFIVENARSFFGVLLFVWVVRSFLVQPYRVPTGSLQPTVEPGDFLVVNQFAYGLRFPVINTKLVPIGEPKRGDVVLFYAPPDPSIVFAKRVIGLPGDHIEYRDKTLFINGKEMKQTEVGPAMDNEPAVAGNPEEHIPVMVKEEDLDGVKHKIYVNLDGRSLMGNIDVIVPPGNYFMMGDNRDNSDDSRMWGFVPENFLIGKAFGIWMSWDALQHKVRWDRIGKSLS